MMITAEWLSVWELQMFAFIGTHERDYRWDRWISVTLSHLFTAGTLSIYWARMKMPIFHFFVYFTLYTHTPTLSLSLYRTLSSGCIINEQCIANYKANVLMWLFNNVSSYWRLNARDEGKLWFSDPNIYYLKPHLVHTDGKFAADWITRCCVGWFVEYLFSPYFSYAKQLVHLLFKQFHYSVCFDSWYGN